MPEDADLEQEAVDFMEDVQSDLERPEDITAERVEDLVMAGLVAVTPSFKLEDGSFPVHYYGLLIFVYAVYQVRNCFM